MIANQKEFYGGMGLMGGFLLVLLLIFLPLYQGQNGLNYLDNLFNSISKDSAYYIPGLKESVAKGLQGKKIALQLKVDDPKKVIQAADAIPLFTANGAMASAEGNMLTVQGDMDRIMAGCLEDADAAFHNDKNGALQGKYGMEVRKAMYTWYVSLKAMQKALEENKQFDERKIVYTVMTKAVECSYNYYTIEPQSMTSRLGVVVFALVFYVIYTLWYGYAIMFMFEGWGLKISH